jgi:chitinase
VIRCTYHRPVRLLLALAFVLILLVGPAQGARTVPAHMLMGYYVGYERDLMPPDEIEWDALTHIAVGVALPNQNGTLNLEFDLGPGEGPAFAQDLAQRAHAHGVVPILMVGGADTNDLFRAAVKHKKVFVKNLVTALQQLGYDGLDIDWEPLGKRDESPFKALVIALRKALPGAVLTAPVEPTTLTFPKVSKMWKKVAPLLDRVDLMTYGMEGAYEGWQSWHSSALDGASPTTPTSVEFGVGAFLAAGVPAAKLGVGIGFFGDCWTAPVTGPGQDLGGATIAATDSDMSTRTILDDYYSPGAAHVDPNAHVPYLSFGAPTGPAGCTYITYEDQASIAAKGAWALGQGLGGAIVWTINQGHDPAAQAGQRDALLRSARIAFGA